MKKTRQPAGKAAAAGAPGADHLGAGRTIPRRDFLQGALVGAAGALCGPLLSPPVRAAASSPTTTPYPPALTGLRGAHPGSFEAAHALRDGTPVPRARDTGERYDLIVVGAGISGLAAAHFYRKHAGRTARILLLDNHDDFGGHAKRNEFVVNGRLLLVNGGTLDIDSPRPYSRVADALLRELGIDVGSLARKAQDLEFYHRLGMQEAAFFDRETFGTDRLVVGMGDKPTRAALAAAPLPPQAREDLARLAHSRTDYLPGLTSNEKKERLSRMSYLAYLRDVVRVHPAVLSYCQALTLGEWGVGIDAVPALDMWGFGLPGFLGLRLARGATERMSPTAAGYHETGGSPYLHFPDGNATIARLLVRSLIPAAAPGADVDDVMTARFDYARLDEESQPIRLRLSSIVARARNDAGEVEVTYLRGQDAHTVRGRQCVLACWNMMIPYLCPELPAAQQEALHSLVKTPLVYTNVALRNWRAFKELGVSTVYAPGSYFSNVYLTRKVDIGDYRTPADPDEPTVVRLERIPCKPGLSEHDQNRAGRAELLATPFATFESQLREQLQRTLAPGGFDAARDIAGITVNRWPHGYAPEFNALWDPVLPQAQQPWVLGRARYGQIAIANADAGAAAYTDAAIDQAHRAVGELLAG